MWIFGFERYFSVHSSSSPGLAAKGGDSSARGCEFKSRLWILDIDVKNVLFDPNKCLLWLWGAFCLVCIFYNQKMYFYFIDKDRNK